MAIVPKLEVSTPKLENPDIKTKEEALEALLKAHKAFMDADCYFDKEKPYQSLQLLLEIAKTFGIQSSHPYKILDILFDLGNDRLKYNKYDKASIFFNEASDILDIINPDRRTLPDPEAPNCGEWLNYFAKMIAGQCRTYNSFAESTDELKALQENYDYCLKAFNRIRRLDPIHPELLEIANYYLEAAERLSKSLTVEQKKMKEKIQTEWLFIYKYSDYYLKPLMKNKNDLGFREIPKDIKTKSEKFRPDIIFSEILIKDIIDLKKINHFKTSQDSYTLKLEINLKEAEEIFKQTGFKVPIPPKQESIKDYWLYTSEKSLLCIGFSTQKKCYVAIKCARKTKMEQEALEALHRNPSKHLMTIFDQHEITIDKDVVVNFLVMKLAGFGDSFKLKDYINRIGDPELSEQLLFCFAEGVLQGLADMHNAKVYHFDVRPENLALEQNGDALLLDFECSSHSETPSIILDDKIGDTAFFAPERHLANHCKNETLYNAVKIDAFAAGLTLFLLGEHNLSAHTATQFINFHLKKIAKLQEIIEGEFYIKHPPLPIIETTNTNDDEPLPAQIPITIQQEYIHSLNQTLQTHFKNLFGSFDLLKNPEPSGFWSFVASLLEADPEKRKTPKEALEHPWFVKMKQKSPEWRKQIIEQLNAFLQKLQNARTKLSPDHFIPRPHLQDTIEQQLLKKLVEKEGMIVLQGRYGMGKATLLNHIVGLDSIKNQISHILILSHSNLNIREVQIMKAADQVGILDLKRDPKSNLKSLYEHLNTKAKETGKQWAVLFVTENFELLEPYLPPPGTRCIVVTKNPNWKSSSPIVIDTMTETESIDLVKTQFPKTSTLKDPEILAFCKALNFVPLSIVTACAYIRAESISFTEYLALLQKQISNLTLLAREKCPALNHFPASMLAVWEITLKTLKSKDPEVWFLLERLSYLPPGEIIEPIMDFVLLIETDMKKMHTYQTLESFLAKLNAQFICQKYGMLKVNEHGTISINNLSQLAVRTISQNKNANEILIPIMSMFHHLLKNQPANLIIKEPKLLELAEAILQYANSIKHLSPLCLKWMIHTCRFFSARFLELGLIDLEKRYFDRAITIQKRIDSQNSVALPLDSEIEGLEKDEKRKKEDSEIMQTQNLLLSTAAKAATTGSLSGRVISASTTRDKPSDYPSSPVKCEI